MQSDVKNSCFGDVYQVKRSLTNHVRRMIVKKATLLYTEQVLKCR